MTTQHIIIMDRRCCWLFLTIVVSVAFAAPNPISTTDCENCSDLTSTIPNTENPDDGLNMAAETTMDPEFTTLLDVEEEEETATAKEPSILLNEEALPEEPSSQSNTTTTTEKKIESTMSEDDVDDKEGLEMHDKPLSRIPGDLPEDPEVLPVESKEIKGAEFTTTSEENASSVESDDSERTTEITEDDLALKMQNDPSQESTTERKHGTLQDSTATISTTPEAKSSITEETSTVVSGTHLLEAMETSEDPATTEDKVKPVGGDIMDLEGYAADSPSLESASVGENDQNEKVIVPSSTMVTTTLSEQISDDSEVQKYISGSNLDLVAAVQFLHYHDKESSEQCNKLVSAHWDYATNLSEENKQQQLFQTLEYQKFCKEAWTNATSFSWKSFNDTVLRRWFKGLSILGDAVLSEDKLKQLNELKAEMKSIYSTAKVCKYKKDSTATEGDDGQDNSVDDSECNLALDPDLTRIMAKSRDYDELLHAWKSWRDSAGTPIREKYWNFVEISNEAARLNGFRDTGELWREAYESDTFQQNLQDLWDQLKPLYENLHAYVRRRLIAHYGSDKIKDDGPIPAHLFGNMWAQSWVSLMEIMQPFPGKPSLDITPTMEAKNMTALEMFNISEEFFTSLGLKAMPEKFWNYSMIEKPTDREVICHASAWDFCNGEDFRIKQCTDVTMEDLITVHHEMGHIQYFLQYAKQPNVFREGANPGFHEAIGDVLALSVSTPSHLKSIGLLENVADDPEGDLNFLMSAAFEKVAFLPYGYLIDLWRWGLFSGNISKQHMNSKWWELRLKYQGICPPVSRTENDFDPGAKYHIPGNTPYIRYFVSHVIQFQMHKALCDASGHEGPLHKCDIYKSQAAGQILSQVMELGSSEHWSEVMKIMTGGATDKMDAKPILEYFDPLLQYLKEQNKNETLGWESDDPLQCP